MTAGRGWIALALVVFSTWKPLWLALGSLLFGFVTIAQFQAEGLGLDLSPNCWRCCRIWPPSSCWC